MNHGLGQTTRLADESPDALVRFSSTGFHRVCVRLFVNIVYDGDALQESSRLLYKLEEEAEPELAWVPGPACGRVINASLISKAGSGENFVVSQLRSARSLEARENLFAVMLDLVLAKDDMEDASAAMFVDFLVAGDAAVTVSSALSMTPDGFRQACEAVLVELRRAYPDSEVLSSKLATEWPESMAQLKLQLAVEFDDVVKSMLSVSGDDKVDDMSLSLLAELLESDDGELFAQGTEWLKMLLVQCYFPRTQPKSKDVVFPVYASSIKALHDSLRLSSRPDIRCAYLDVIFGVCVELRMMKTQQDDGDLDTNFVLELFCEHLLNFQGDQDVIVVQRMVDLLAELCCVRVRRIGQLSSSGELQLANPNGGSQGYFLKSDHTDERSVLWAGGNALGDSLLDEWVRCRSVSSVQVFESVPLAVTQYLMTRLSFRRADAAPAKVFLFHSILAQISQDSDSPFDVNFFKELLEDSHAYVAYMSGKVIIDQLAQTPEHYRSVLSKVIAKSQDIGNENYVSNYFLQCRAILQLLSKWI
jgi:hypothetical protein